MPRTGPTIAAATTIGVGLGGFVDGIVLHQILQWHQMISAWVPPVTLTAKNLNMVWDGIFHVFTWTATVVGLGLLWRAVMRDEVVRSTPMFLGSLLLGWGIFNVVDSFVNHYGLNTHNVREAVANPMLYNHGFFALAVLQVGAGGYVVHRARRAWMEPAEPSEPLPPGLPSS